MIKFWLLLNFLLDSVPFAYFSFSALKKDLHYTHNKATFFLWVLGSATVSTIFWLFVFAPFFEYEMLRFLKLGAALTLLFILLALTKWSKAKALLVYSIIIPISLGFQVVSATISHTLNLDAPDFMVSSLLRLGLIVFLYPLMLWAWRKMGREANRLTDPTIWKYLWLIPGSIAFADVMFTDRIFEFEPPSLSGLIGRLVLCFGSLSTCWLVFFLANRFEQRIHLQDAQERTGMLLDVQRQQYIELAESIEQARSYRHDLRHHLNAMSSMLLNKEYAGLQEYLDNLLGTVSSGKHILICENFAANALLDNYIHKATDANIPIKVNFRLSNSLGISDGDLCVLLGNAVENAIEATEKVAPEKRFISINATEEKHAVYMTFDNSFDGRLERDGDNIPFSRKRDYASTGIGLLSIKAIVKKYDGDMKIDVSDDVYKLSIMISKPQ